MLDWAKFYLEQGLSVIPIKFKSKEPLVSWKEYQNRKPTEEEIKKWFSEGFKNIAIVCGAVSGNLVVFDFDSKETFQQFLLKVPEQIVEKVKKTWVVRTGKGIHVYFRTQKPPKSTTLRVIGLDIQGEGKYVVAPPSLHPSGKIYEFITDLRKSEIITLTDEEYELILSEFKEKEGEKEEPKLQRLSEGQKEQIVKLILPYWTKGRRHLLALMIAGALYWHGYDVNDAIAIIEEICKKTKDEEIKDRIRAVEDTFKRASETNIAYKTWLQKAGISGEEYDRIVLELLDIIKGSFIVGNGKLTVRKNYNTLIVADFNKAIIRELKVKKDGEIFVSDTIAMAVPERVRVIQTEDAELLKVSFRTPEGFVLTLEGDIEEIVNQLKKNTVRVTSRRKIEDALSLIISKMIQINWCEVVRGEKVVGLVINDGDLVAVDYDMNLPDPAEVKEALELLNKFVELSEFSQSRVKKIAKLIKWFTIAGLGWVYKQKGLWIPHCYIYGESDTGKSKSAQFLSNIWKEFPSLSLGSIDSPYRFGLAISQTTFPVVVNEMDFDSLDSEIIELWKNAVESQVVRSRYGRKVKAYGVFCFTSNTSVPTNKAIQKRLIIIHFDPTDSEILTNQREKFEKLELERKKLQAIGRFVANYIKSNIDIITNVPWEELAELLLSKCYEYAGLEIPKWVKEKDKDEEEDTRSSKAEEIRAVIFSECAKYVHEYYDEANAYSLFYELSKKIPWICTREREGDVVLLRPLLKLLKQHDIKLASLKDLTYYIPNAKYVAKIKVSGRVLSGVIVDPVEFGKWLGFISFVDETEREGVQEWLDKELERWYHDT